MTEDNENKEFIVLFIFVGLILNLSTNIILIMMMFHDRTYYEEMSDYHTNKIINEIRKIK